ncbi:MAG: adenylosuccinate lyase [Gemmatimonadetes bacterium]|nr:adenylosuccinate lyase [Gemmatimonadota bacterium]
MTDASPPRYQSPLSSRYASPAMLNLWSERHKIGLWRRIWLALMDAQRDLGVAIPETAIAELKTHLDDCDLAQAAQFERRFRHDVMAHVHALGEQAPAARPFIHLGATSAFVTDNADLMVMRDGLRILLGRLVALLRALGAFANRQADFPCLAYTHFQPAQLTTVGKRATLWAQDFALDVEELLHRLETLRARGCKGTTGTQASFLELFKGDHAKVRQLDEAVTRRLGFDSSFPVTGQTYSRKADSQILDCLSGIAQSASKMASDLRLLQHEGELLEPFESEQIGSSAMAYKRNPMRAERINALARFVISLGANTAHTAATQWLERTLDDSANRRLTLPEAFLATDAILILATNIVAGLEVRDAVIARHVAEQMPFMATERWMMLGVEAGGDRQALHEVIRQASQAVARQVSGGGPNDLLDRLSAAPEFGAVDPSRLRAELDPLRYVGRAPEQTREFLTEFLTPLIERAAALANDAPIAEIRV